MHRYQESAGGEINRANASEFHSRPWTTVRCLVAVFLPRGLKRRQRTLSEYYCRDNSVVSIVYEDEGAALTIPRSAVNARKGGNLAPSCPVNTRA